MQCRQHRKKVQHFCVSEQYKYQPLCAQCRISKKYPLQSIISVSQACIKGEINLSVQEQLLQQHIKPIQNKKQLQSIIETQKKAFESQRKRLHEIIDKRINTDLRVLQDKNKKIFDQKQKKILQDMINEKNKIKDLRYSLKNNVNKLREAVYYNADKMIKLHQQMREPRTHSTDTIYKYSEPICYEMNLSGLELRLKHLNRDGDGMGSSFFTVRPPQRKFNISPLYFKIDQPNASHFLHYFFPKDNVLKIFNLKTWRWQEHQSNQPILPKGDTVKFQQIFYWIGGEQYQKPTNKILYYDDNKKCWGNLVMKEERRSPMTVIFKNQIYIVGGQSSTQSLKSYQILNPVTKIIRKSQHSTNFSTSQGTLVNFNQQYIFKIGGINLSQKQRNKIHLIQKMNAKGIWQFVQFQTNVKLQLLFNTHQAAIQINSNQIMIFGGTQSHNSYLLEVQKIKGLFGGQGEKYAIKWFNQKPLISNDNFNCCKPTIHQQSIFSLQNVSEYPFEKRLLHFDMYEWHEIQNIIVG